MPVHIYASRSSPPQFPPPNQPFFPARFHAPLPPLQVSVSPLGSHSPRPVFPPAPPPFPNFPVQAIFFPFCACLSRRRTGRPAGRPEKNTEAPLGASPGTRSTHPPEAPLGASPSIPPNPRRRENPAAARTARRQRLLPAVHSAARPYIVPPKNRAADRRHRTRRHRSGRPADPPLESCRLLSAPCRAGNSPAPYTVPPAAIAAGGHHLPPPGIPGGGTQCLQKEAPYTVPPIGGTVPGGTACRAANRRHHIPCRQLTAPYSARPGGKQRTPIGVPKNRPPC